MWKESERDVHRHWEFVPPSSSATAVQLTCAICLDPPDGRLLQLLRRDCELPCVSWNLCQSHSVSSVEDFRCVQHYCNTGTHIFIQHHGYTGLLFTLTINHPLHGPLKVSFSSAVGVRLHTKRCWMWRWSDALFILSGHFRPQRRRNFSKKSDIKLSAAVYNKAYMTYKGFLLNVNK